MQREVRLRPIAIAAAHVKEMRVAPLGYFLDLVAIAVMVKPLGMELDHDR